MAAINMAAIITKLGSEGMTSCSVVSLLSCLICVLLSRYIPSRYKCSSDSFWDQNRSSEGAVHICSASSFVGLKDAEEIQLSKFYRQELKSFHPYIL